MTIAEFWSERYRVVVDEKKTLGEMLRETLKENKKLQQQINGLKASLTYIALKNMETENKDLQARIINLNSSNESLKKQLKQKEEENASLRNVVDSFVDKCKELEDKAEGYKKERDEKIELLNAIQDKFTKAELEAKLEDMTQRCENITLSLRIVNERLDKSIADRKELQADRDFWVHDSAEKMVEIQSLKTDLDDTKKQLEEIKHEFKQSYSDGYSDGNEEGQNELWEMLQMVKDMSPNEFDTECECLGDVIDMDLEDFKEAYGKWEAEQKKAAEEAKNQHVEYMRDYLKKFCVGKLCFGCPLYNASEPVSSCLFSKLTDEEVEKKYSKVIDSECKKTPRYFTSAIEAVFTAEAKINKDMLKDICGIKDTNEEET